MLARAIQRFPEWSREALAKTLTGVALGLMTSGFMYWLSQDLIPAFADYDYDFGLRFHRLVEERIAHRADGVAPDARDGSGYVFLDVDPDLDPRGGAAATHPSTQDNLACKALVTHMRKLVGSPTGAAPRAVTGSIAPESIDPARDCSASRPLNRHLLAELVRGLRDRGARLIILDVELRAESGIISSDENEDLAAALQADASAHANSWAVIPVPAELDWIDHMGTHLRLIGGDDISPVFSAATLGRQTETAAPRETAIVLSAVLPAPGQPVRRYPRCYQTDQEGVDVLPSLPYAAAVLMAHPDIDRRQICHEPPRQVSDPPASPDSPGALFESPRIVYSLPSMHGDEDASFEGRDDDFRIWRLYRQVYRHCLAAHFWATDKACGGTEEYAGKVVVVGASNRLRRDLHATPIGTMAGSEVVINAIRSFTLDSARTHASAAERGLDELPTLLACAFVWFLYYCCVHLFPATDPGVRPAQGAFRGHVWLRRLVRFVGRSTLILILLAVTFVTTAAIVGWAAYSSLFMLVAVAAVGIDAYGEAVAIITSPIDALFGKLVCLPRRTR